MSENIFMDNRARNIEGSGELPNVERVPIVDKDDEVIVFGLMSDKEKTETMKLLLDGRDFVVLDIGPGFDPPFLSVEQQKNDIWFGVDRMLSKDPNTRAKKDKIRVEKGSKRVLVPGVIHDLPDFKADLIMMIAPNPQDIVDNNLLDGVGRFCKKGTVIYVLMDKRTHEYLSYGKEARQIMKTFLARTGFEEDDLDIGDRDIKPQSRDAVGGTVFSYVKYK